MLELYELTAVGRRMQRSLVYTTDGRFSLADLEPPVSPKLVPWPRGTRHCAGAAFEGAVQNIKWADAIGSVVIHRQRDAESLKWRALSMELDGKGTVEAEENWCKGSGERKTFFEEYVPPRALRGLIPDSLLDPSQGFDFCACDGLDPGTCGLPLPSSLATL